MIKNIKCINYKSFNNLDLHNIYFKKLNLIFGYNGKGKSSFVNFIKENIENVENISYSENEYDFFIYDELYKRDTLYINDDEQQDSFKSFYLGNDIFNIVKEKKIIQEAISKLNEDKNIQTSEWKRVNTNIEDLKSKIAKDTKNILYEINPKKYKGDNSYNKNHIKEIYFNDAESLSSEEFESIKKYTVNNDFKEIILFEFDYINNILGKIVELEKILKETPENNAIDRFKNDEELENFARMAIKLKDKYPKEYMEKCPLCEQSIIQIKLWENLEKHFNKEYSDFLEKLKNIQTFFISFKKELEYFRDWLDKNLTYDKLTLFKKINIDEIRNEYLDMVSFINDNLTIILNIIEEKTKLPNSSDISLKLDKNLNSYINKIIEYDDIKKIIETHNNNEKKYNSIINDNIEKVKKHFISQYKDIYMKYKDELDNINNVISNINEKIENKSQELENINKRLDEHNDSFRKLNEDLEKWFFKDIKFFKISDSYYKTQRKDCKGEWIDCKSGLSEGEKTIISIIYFMNFYSSSLENIEKFPILIIDDPINSLDSSNKDKICNYILYKIFNNLKGQIFILSHDKDFLIKINKELNKKIHDKNYSFLKNDDKIILSIEKENLVSKIKTLENIKNYNEIRYMYNELKKYIENPDLNLDIEKMNLPRMFLEKIFAICFDNDKNFTNCYDTFISLKKLPKKYTADDIQNPNHNKNDSDLSAEAREKCKFVIDIFEQCFNIEIDNK